MPTAVHDPGVGHVAPGQHLGHELHQAGVRDAEHLSADAAGVRERAEDVEHGGHAELQPHRCDVAHRRVERPGEGEPDAGLGDARGDPGAVDVERHAELLEQVEGAGRGRRLAVAVLAHGGAGGRGHERRHGGDVEGGAAEHGGPAGPDDVDRARRVRQLERGGGGDHRLDEADDLVGGLALLPERHDERSDLCRGGLALEDQVQRAPRDVTAEGLAGDEAPEDAGPGAGVGERSHGTAG